MSRQMPTGVKIIGILMFIVSIWWLILGGLYFFGGFFWIFAGWIGAWMWLYGSLLFFLGLIGLGVAGGIMRGYRGARIFTIFICILGLLFSVPSLESGYGIVGAIIYAIILIYLFTPNVKAFFSQG